MLIIISYILYKEEERELSGARAEVSELGASAQATIVVASLCFRSCFIVLNMLT